MPVWILPLPALLTAALCALGKTERFIRRASVTSSLAGLLLAGAAPFYLASGLPVKAGGGFFLDALGAYLALIISLLAVAVSLGSGEFMEREALSHNLGIQAWRTYYGLFHLFLATMLAVAIADNLGLLWILVEATTLASAFLVGFHRHRHSVEAAWKYVMLCSIGIAFALLGTILFYYASVQGGNGHGLNWSDFMHGSRGFDPKLVKLAFLFIAVGYGTKAGLAPLHTWLPDAHSQAPSPISAMLSGVLLTSSFYALVRFYALAARCIGPLYPGRILVFFGLASLAIAAPFIIAARDYKRMLAYSSVEHMGLAALGVGIGSPLAIAGAFLHLLFHALAKATAFLGAGRILDAYGTRKISKVKGALSLIPETAIPYLAAVLALSGLPPFGIFTSEMMVLAAGFAEGRARTAAAALLLLALIFAGLLNHASRMSFGLPSKEGAAPEKQTARHSWTLPASAAVAALILLGLRIPQPLDRWLEAIVRVVRG